MPLKHLREMFTAIGFKEILSYGAIDKAGTIYVFLTSGRLTIRVRDGHSRESPHVREGIPDREQHLN